MFKLFKKEEKHLYKINFITEDENGKKVEKEVIADAPTMTSICSDWINEIITCERI